MFKRILLALTFVAALGVAGLGMSNSADAYGGCHRSSYYGGGYGGYAPYGYGYGGPRHSMYYGGGYGGGYGGYHGYPSRGYYGHRGHGHSGISFSFGF